MTGAAAGLDVRRFGPWAVVTGASSGIGQEFALRLAAGGINVVLVARRLGILRRLADELSTQYGVACRPIGVDLTSPAFLSTIEEATRDLDVGLLVSNAGAGMPGRFLSQELDALRRQAQLNALAHLDLVHHFGRRLAARGRGGIVLVSAAGSRDGIPYMANDAAAKAYVHSLGHGLHVEFAERGVSVSVLVPGPTDTPVLADLGFQPGSSPVKPLSVQRCVSESLEALATNRSSRTPGRLFRVLTTVLPGGVTRRMMGRMVRQWIDRRPVDA